MALVVLVTESVNQEEIILFRIWLKKGFGSHRATDNGRWKNGFCYVSLTWVLVASHLVVGDEKLVQVIFDAACKEKVIAAVEGVSRSFREFAKCSLNRLSFYSVYNPQLCNSLTNFSWRASAKVVIVEILELRWRRLVTPDISIWSIPIFLFLWLLPQWSALILRRSVANFTENIRRLYGVSRIPSILRLLIIIEWRSWRSSGLPWWLRRKFWLQRAPAWAIPGRWDFRWWSIPGKSLQSWVVFRVLNSWKDNLS